MLIKHTKICLTALIPARFPKTVILLICGTIMQLHRQASILVLTLHGICLRVATHTKPTQEKELSGDIWLSRGLVIYNNFDKEKCVIKFLDHLFNVYSNLLQLNLLDKYRALLVQSFKEPINNMRCFFKTAT